MIIKWQGCTLCVLGGSTRTIKEKFWIEMLYKLVNVLDVKNLG